MKLSLVLGVALLAAGLLAVLSAAGLIDPRGIARATLRPGPDPAGPAGQAASAGPAGRDGQWVAEVPVQGRCPAAHMTLFVDGGNILGNVVNASGTFPITGHIDAAGNGTIRILDFSGRIAFLGDRFAVDYFNNCGERRAAGKRLAAGAPD